MNRFWCNIIHALVARLSPTCEKGNVPAGIPYRCEDCIAFNDHLLIQGGDVGPLDTSFSMSCGIYPQITVYPNKRACKHHSTFNMIECATCRFSSFQSQYPPNIYPLAYCQDMVSIIEEERGCNAQ